MKLSPEDSKLMQRMAPGALCRDGFLGDDPRPLGEILDSDRSTVEGLGLTHEDIATALAGAMQAAMPACGAPVAVGDRLTATYSEAMGRIPSPWGDGVFPKGEIALTDTATGETILFTPLSVHLISRHGFYQGRRGRYRVEPAAVARLFGLGR